MLLVGMIGLLFLFSLIGMEIAWAIGIACFGYLVLSNLSGDGTPMVLFAQQMTVGVDAFVLLAIPLFIFAGELMNLSGVTQRIIRFASTLVGHKNGGLANVGVTANFIMSGCSGSALADCAATCWATTCENWAKAGLKLGEKFGEFSQRRFVSVVTKLPTSS